MSSDFPTLVGGRWGVVDHQDMNALFDAARRVFDMAEGDQRRPPSVLATFWAKLVGQETVVDQPAWTFQQIGKQAGPVVDTFTGALTTALYPSGQGRAIDLGGNGAIGDKVLMHELVAFDGRRWFAFAKGSGGGGGTTDVKLLTITSATPSGQANQWNYKVTPSGEAANQDAMNLYEGSPWGHGQQINFQNLGTLAPDKVQGVVIGLRVSLNNWRFDVPNPLVPTCSTP